jgi:putative SOS response-associated peptidase YedK
MAETPGRQEAAYWIGMADNSLFAFAGLWERWKDPANGETVRTFTVITCPPNEHCAPIHNRMSVTLDRDAYPRWLGEEPASLDELRGCSGLYRRSRCAAIRSGRGLEM